MMLRQWNCTGDDELRLTVQKWDILEKSKNRSSSGKQTKEESDNVWWIWFNEVKMSKKQRNYVMSILKRIETSIVLTCERINSNTNSDLDTCVSIDAHEDKLDCTQNSQPVVIFRIGTLGKGLVLAEDDCFDLVMMCYEEPTRSFLEKVMRNLKEILKVTTIESEMAFSITSVPNDAKIIITVEHANIKLTFNVFLSSTKYLNEVYACPSENNTPIPDTISSDFLDPSKCYQAALALRQTHWFQTNIASGLNCLMIVFILRALAKRHQSWACLSLWTLGVLCKQIIPTHYPASSIRSGLHRILETVAKGLLLPEGLGLRDPCLKNSVDAAEYITKQQRSDITKEAENSLLLLNSNRFHELLGISESKLMCLVNEKMKIL